MEFTLLPELDVEMECLSLLSCYVCDSEEPSSPCPPSKMRAHYVRTLSLSSARADALFGPLERVYDAVLASLPLRREDLQADFAVLPGTAIFPAQNILRIERLLARILPLSDLPRRDLLAQLVSAYFAPPAEEELPAVTEGSFGAALAGSGYPAATKWAIYELYLQFDDRSRALKALLERVKPVFLRHAPLLAPLTELFSEQLGAALRNAGSLEAFLKQHGLTLDVSAVTAQPMAFSATSLSFESDEYFSQSLGLQANTRLWLGVLFCAVEEEEARRDPVDTLVGPLKALCDKRRLQILFMLYDGPLYAQEIVQRTGLTGATVSHHMNELLNEELVDIQKEGVRFRYTLRRERIRALLSELQHALT